MVSGGLLSLLLFLSSLSVSSSFLLQTPRHLSLKNATLFTPAVICKTFLCKFNIQTSNICRHRPSPSSPTHLLSPLSPPSNEPNASPKRDVSPCICPYNISSLFTKSYKALARSDAPMLRHKLKLFFCPISVVSMSHPHPLVSDGRILPGHGLSLTVISL